MQPITVPAAVLRSAYAVLSRLIPNRPTLPVLQAIRIERQQNRILISGTDLDRWVTFQHLIEPDPITELARSLALLRWPREAAAVLVPKAAMQAALKGVDGNGSITFEPTPRASGEGELLTIRYPLNGTPVSTPVDTWPDDDFPAEPEVFAAHGTTLDADARGAVVETAAFASVDETRYVLNGVYLETRWNEEPCQPAVVGTDGRRLHRRPVPALMPLGVNLILPSSTVDLLGLPALLALDWKLFTDEKVKHVRILAGDWKMTSKTVDGNYPNYRQVIPGRHAASVALTVTVHDQFLSVLNKLPKPTKGRSEKESIRLRFHRDHLDIECPHTQAKVSLPGVQCDSPRPKVISLNRHYLRAMLAVGPGTLRLIDSLSPVCYETRRRAVHVCMPMRVA